MRRPHPFRLEKRHTKRGRVYYVVYDGDPAHPKSTGVLVDRADRRTREEPAGLEVASAWSYAHMDGLEGRKQLPTIGEFARDMFTADDPWVKLQARKSRELQRNYLQPRRSWLNAYIIPRWGACRPETVRPQALDEWLLELQRKNGLPLSRASLDRILWIMRHIFDQLAYVYPGSLTHNPARQVTPFDRRTTGREPFTIEEIHKLFPRDWDAALRVWQTPSWYGFFLMQWTCGLRPGEAAGFMLQDWIRELHGAVIRRTVENRTGEIKEGLKTERRGMAVKPVVFSEQLEELLERLEADGAASDDLLFRSPRGLHVMAESANKHLRASAERAGLELGQRTQYCFRHTYYTELLKRLPEKEVARMAGHRALRKEYDHRQGVDFLRQAQPLRDVINELSA